MLHNEWSKYLQKFLFLLKDGFFELPYLSNSPHTMLSSISKIAVARHLPAEQIIATNNPFCNGVMQYRQLEDGLWLFATEIEIKENIMAKASYDDAETNDYFFLTFSVFEYEFPIKDKFNNNVTLLSVCWTFYRPGTEVTTYFYKNTKGRFYNLVFHKKWAERFLSDKGMLDNTNIKNLLKGELGFFTWLDIAPNAHQIAKRMLSLLNDENKGALDVADLREAGLDLASEFFNYVANEQRADGYEALTNSDYYKIARAEKMVLLNLSMPFVGVGTISNDTSISPTKLKASFKTIFGFSILQYHKEKNMLLAQQLLHKTNDQIKVISSLTGHNSNSKFASAYKKRFGYLPSEAKK